jgi:hypothetical protein
MNGGSNFLTAGARIFVNSMSILSTLERHICMPLVFAYDIIRMKMEQKYSEPTAFIFSNIKNYQFQLVLQPFFCTL